MSSTPAVSTPISLASSVSLNAPSSPSVPLSYIPSGVSELTLLASVTTSLNICLVTTSASSKQSQQPSSASQTTMSLTPVATTASPTSETSSVSSSTVPSSSAKVSSGSSASSVITPTSGNVDPPTTTQGSSVQLTTLSTATPSSTTQVQTPSNTISSIPISIVPSTSDIPSPTTSSSSSSLSPSQSSSPAGIVIPLTTVLESTTVFVTGTNSQGQVVTSVPPVVTEVITTTGSGGIATTVTQAIVNPTLASNNIPSGGSSFFSDPGAVVGVFVVVGLASASILMWMLFAIRRRQRMRRIEQDSVIEAAVAAAGFNRAPLDDGDDGDSPISPNTRQISQGMDQRANPSLGDSGSLPTSSRLSEAPDDPARGGANSHREFRAEHRARSHPEGYVPAHATNPLSPARQFTVSSRKSSYGHTPTYSAGSFEPLLANYAQNVADQDAPPMEPSQNPSSRRRNSGLGPNGYSSDGTPEDASRPSLRRRNSCDGSVLQEEDVYAHYVLMVRNIPDNQSQHSE